MVDLDIHQKRKKEVEEYIVNNKLNIIKEKSETEINQIVFWYPRRLEPIEITNTNNEITFYNKKVVLNRNDRIKIIGNEPLELNIPEYIPEYNPENEQISQKNILLHNNSIIELGKHCFNHCTTLQTVTIPESVTKLDSLCFMDCYRLKSIKLPTCLYHIGRECFYECVSLQYITIPENVTEIGTLCFAECKKLSSINIPENINYISFFSNNTRTFYEPYVESRIDEPILDNRHRFKLGKINHLYFYSKLDNEFIDLDELPTCTINDIVYPVTRHRKGCYYATVNALNNFRHDELYYDIWSGLKYQGDDIDDVEMSFTTNKGHALTLGESYTSSKKIDATIIGINDYEKIFQGEKRELNVIFRVPYQSSCYDLYEKAFYRLYIKDGKDEVNVIDWDSIDILDNFNSFVIDFATLLPHEYHIDIKLYNGKNTQIFKDITKFIVVDTNNNKI